MPTTTQVQIGMEDRFIEDPELQELLERREEAKAPLAEARAAFNKLDAEAKAKVMGLEIAPDEEVRCGRFMLSKKQQTEEEKSFTQHAKTTAKIKTLKVPA